MIKTDPLQTNSLSQISLFSFSLTPSPSFSVYLLSSVSFTQSEYSRVPGDRNWHIETSDYNLPGFFTIVRNLLAGIWGGFLRFIKTGFRNWLAAFLGFFYDFSMMSMIFL